MIIASSNGGGGGGGAYAKIDVQTSFLLIGSHIEWPM